MLSTLLATKLFRPHPAPNLVARPRLTRRLDQGLRDGHPLFLVVAPAGYGKTTLVTDWLGKTGTPSAWLSLDEADNDPPRFFTYVVTALQQSLGPKLAQPLLEAFPMMPRSAGAWVHLLINDLSTLARPVLLVLDDYHVITSGPVQEAMAFLLDHAPPNLHLVVLTRADPTFPLPRLRVRGLMTEIRDRDLRFTPEEMTDFLNSRHHLDLDAEQITALESRTEGWAAGVQLAALSLQGCTADDAAQFIAAFSGSHHYIVDYLVDEVLRRQPDHVHNFLLQTSILDRMCTPVCDALLSRTATQQGNAADCSDTVSTALQSPGDALPLHCRSQEILEHLERSHLFLVPLDDERRWYRYHHLFLDVLRQKHIAGSVPGQIPGLHGRASDWYWQNGYIADGIHHALMGGDHERAAELVEEHAWSMVQRAELATVREWIRALPGHAVSARPWLHVYSAWALLFADSVAAQAQLEAVERPPQSGGAEALPAEMQGHIAAIRAWMAYMRGDHEGAVVLAQQALEVYPQMDATVRSGLMMFLAVGYFLESDWMRCERAYAEAADLARSCGSIMLEVLSRTSLGSLSEMLGRLHEAEAIFQHALRIATQARSPVAGQPYACLARVYREWNDLASARHFAEKLIECSAMWGVVDALACGHLMLATVLQAQKDIPGANQALAEASELTQQYPLELRSMPWLGATRAKLWLAQGRLDQARRWAETRGLSAEATINLGNEVELLALAHILLAESRLDEATSLLARLQSTIESAGRLGNLIEPLVLLAMVLHRQSDTRSALAALERAVSLARPEGYTRVFLDEGEPVETLLEIASAQWQDQDLLAYVSKLLTAFPREAVPPTEAPAPHAGILSERELEVLQLVAAGCSNGEIAQELVIAIGTAKRHVANIFDKLDVRNRTEAVAKARQLGLL